MAKIKCMLCGMVLEEEDYSIPLIFVEKYKYTEAEGIMLGAFISAGLWTIILYFIF